MSISTSTGLSGTDRKALKRPDDFMAMVSKMIAVLGKRSRAVGLVAIALVGFGVVAGVLITRNDTRAHEGLDRLYLAQQLEAKELLAAVPAPPKPVTPAVKGKKAPPPPAPEPSNARFAKLDVDQKFPETIKAYQELITRFPNTRASLEATVALGALYLNHGSPAQAAVWFEKSASQARGKADKALSYYSLGYAQEAQGKYPQAIQAFQDALKWEKDVPKASRTKNPSPEEVAAGPLGIHAEAMLAIARNQELSGQTDAARAMYQRVQTELPQTNVARTAHALEGLLATH